MIHCLRCALVVSFKGEIPIWYFNVSVSIFFWKERGSMHYAMQRTSVFSRFFLHFSIVLFTQSIWLFMNSITTEIMNKTMDQFCIVAFKLKSWTKLKFPNQKQFTNKIVVSSVVFRTQNEQNSTAIKLFPLPVLSTLSNY